MEKVAINIGFSCNNNCIFCIDKNKRSLKQPCLEDLKRRVDMAAKRNCEELYIVGGEPLISKYFFSLLDFAKTRGIKKMGAETNGRMLCYEDFVKKIKKYEPIKFTVSFHFPNAFLYKKYCLADGFYQSVAGIKNLIKYKIDFGINTLIMKPNLLYLEDVINFLKKMGVNKPIYLIHIDGKNIMDKYKEFVPKFSECIDVVQKIIKKNPNIKVQGIPPCIFKEDLRENVVSCFNYSKKPLILTKQIPESDYEKERQGQFQTYKKYFVSPSYCKKCRNRSTCLGIRKDYFKIYGAKELKPI